MDLMAPGAATAADEILYGKIKAGRRRADPKPMVRRHDPDWPLNFDTISFDYNAVNYETDEMLGEEHDTSCAEEGICRCSVITDVRINQISVGEIARALIENIEADQYTQTEAIKSFLRRKAGKSFIGSSQTKIHEAYCQELQRQGIPISRSRWDHRPIRPEEVLTPQQLRYEFDDTDRLVMEEILQETGINMDDFRARTCGGYYGDEVDGIYLEGAITGRITDAWSDYLRSRGRSSKSKLEWLPAARASGGSYQRTRVKELDLKRIQTVLAGDKSGPYVQSYETKYAHELRAAANSKIVAERFKDDTPQAVVAASRKNSKNYKIITGAAAIQGARNAGYSDLRVIVLS